MELEIQDALEDFYKNLHVAVHLEEFRKYKIRLVVETACYDIFFKYDANKTFDVNLNIIKEEIDKCILKYYHRNA